jgi:anti-sigma regulatory factor (Ser/Thr protein kinase)
MQALTLPGKLDSLGAMGQYIMEAAAEAGFPKSAAYKLRLAVDEIVTNIITHGYEESGLTGDVVLSSTVDDKALTISVEDTAVEFDPHSLERPEDIDKPLEERGVGGLGVFLAFENVDEFRYERDGNKNRNIFVMNRPVGAGQATK